MADRRTGSRLILVLAAIVALAIVVLPVAGAGAWYLANERTLEVLVYDSTVPTDDRRQHRAVELALTYFKVPFDSATDYVGTKPGGAPYGEWPTTQPDLVLLVDTYGVYVDAEGVVDEDGSFRISETFPMAAAQDVVRWGEKGTIVMGEFNVLHEPTAPDVSEVLQDLFQIDATGWTGRAFGDLQDASARIQELHSGRWDYDGPGIIIVGSSVGDRTVDPVVIVLTTDELNEHAPIISGVPSSDGRMLEIPYTFWFALIEAQASATTTTCLELPVNEQGRAILEAHGVPLKSPFVVETENTVYVAGNISTTPASFPTRRISGSLPVLQRLPNTPGAAVFYELYAPLLADLLDLADPG